MKAFSQIARFVAVSLLIAVASGCSVLQHLPYNNMCDVPDGSCTNKCCNPQQPEVPTEAEMLHLSADSAPNAQVSDMQQRIESLESSNIGITEQMVTLDKTVEAQRLDREEILALMQNLSVALADVRQELNEHHADIASVTASLRHQRSQNETLLSDVEQQLTDFLSQDDSTAP